MKAQILVRMFETTSEENHTPRPFGVFYDVDRPSYEDLLTDQIKEAQTEDNHNLDDLLRGPKVWEIKTETESVLV